MLKKIMITTPLLAALALTVMPRTALAADDTAKGQSVFTAQKCQVCHSIAGKGAKASPLDGVGTKLSAENIREWIVNPTTMTAKSGSTKKPPMPAKYSSLPAGDLDALVGYLASLK